MLQRGRARFEGWYFKLVDEPGEQPRAIIPGVFLGDDAHAFIQVLDGRAGTSVYHRFALDAFSASRDSFDVSIGRSRFGRSGISLDIEPGETDGGQGVKGSVGFSEWNGWPVTAASPGVMGPYSFGPLMEGKHGILSMDHGLSGALSVDGQQTVYDGGRGYIEKDWGRGFPSGYVWAQSNHFDRPGVSISASVARIPWLTGSFRGYLVGLLLDGQLLRFTTYTGATIDSIAVDDDRYHLSIADRAHRLEITATRAGGALLMAPYEKRMVERVAETMTSTIDVRLCSRAGNDVLFEGTGAHGCLEVQGKLDGVLRD